jgi:hypothetical protein
MDTLATQNTSPHSDGVNMSQYITVSIKIPLYLEIAEKASENGISASAQIELLLCHCNDK